MAEVLPPDPAKTLDPRREAAARAVYRLRPYYIGEKRDPLEDSGVAAPFDWDGAPWAYQSRCYDIADAVLAAIGEHKTPWIAGLEAALRDISVAAAGKLAEGDMQGAARWRLGLEECFLIARTALTTELRVAAEAR